MSIYKDLYKKYKNKYLEMKKQLFIEDNIDYNKLQITPTSIYSMSKPKFAKKITEIVSKFLKVHNKTPGKSTITECCSNVGGDTISFAQKFHKVNAVELNNDEYKNLLNNIKVYKLLDKVNVINNDYTKVMKQLKQDVIYLDPPWGGPGYSKLNTIDMYLSNKNVVDIIYELLLGEYTNFVIMKGPNNYNVNKLINKFINTDYHVLTYNLYDNTKKRIVFKLFIVVNKSITYNDVNGPKIIV